MTPADEGNIVELSQEFDDEDQGYTPEQAPSTSKENGCTGSMKTRGRSGHLEDKAKKLENKVKKKTSAAVARAAKKKSQAMAAVMKRSVNELDKIYRPGECMKHINVEVHPVLAQTFYMADLRRELRALGARLVDAPELVKLALIMWSRTVPRLLAAGEMASELCLGPSREQCGQALYLYAASHVAELVDSRSLAASVAASKAMAGCSLTVVIYGLKDYFKTTGRKTVNSNNKLMTKIDLEMAITDVLVTADCDVVTVDTPNELALLIARLTKAIAEEPYKKAKRAVDEQAGFFMRGDNKNCVAVTDCGYGVDRLWQQMIAVLPLSSLETSRALCAKYKCPGELYDALQAPNGVNEVADIGVARAAVPGSKNRKLGPEFARKLKTIFTEENGNVLIE